MMINDELTVQQSVRLARLQAWAMSFVCSFLCFMAVAAATRIPHYQASADYFRLVGVIMFNLLTFTGLAGNIHTHLCLWRIKD